MGRLKRPDSTQELADQVRGRSSVEDEIDEALLDRDIPVDERAVSTGSTLLDCAISGGRRYGGGIPAGVVVEVFGESSLGKTLLLVETCAGAQAKGGYAEIDDPEARLDSEYSRMLGAELRKDNYRRSKTVTEMFNHIWNWNPKPEKEDAICVYGADSLAALSTELELEKGDKMGMRRGKEFSEGLRKTCRIIQENNWVVFCTNQVREGERGTFTPGGKGIPFYASLRIRLTPPGPGLAKRVTETKTLEGGREIEKTIGIFTIATIVKNSVDEPFREAPLWIIFKDAYGIDDVRANLWWYKRMKKETTFDAMGASYRIMNDAIAHIEDNNLQGQLRKRTINLWLEIEELFKLNRKPKRRF